MAAFAGADPLPRGRCTNCCHGQSGLAINEERISGFAVMSCEGRHRAALTFVPRDYGLNRRGECPVRIVWKAAKLSKLAPPAEWNFTIYDVHNRKWYHCPAASVTRVALARP